MTDGNHQHLISAHPCITGTLGHGRQLGSRTNGFCGHHTWRARSLRVTPSTDSRAFCERDSCQSLFHWKNGVQSFQMLLAQCGSVFRVELLECHDAKCHDCVVCAPRGRPVLTSSILRSVSTPRTVLTEGVECAQLTRSAAFILYLLYLYFFVSFRTF